MSAIIKAGLQGVLSGIASAAQHAEEVSQAFTPESDKEPTAALIGLSQDTLQVKASAKVIKVGEEIDKAVIDLLA